MTDLQTIATLSPTAISAMSALNSHVRSNNARFDEPLKNHVYSMKRRAIDLAEMAGLAMFRPISVVVTCSGCHGDGLFRDRWKCNRCDGTGKAMLYFRETRIGKTLARLDWNGADVVWHTPTSSRESSEFVAVEDWKPLTPGKELSTDEMLDALEIAEPLFGTRERHADYRISLGSDHERCAFCRSTESLVSHSVERGRLRWSASACESCRGHWKANEHRYGVNNIYARFQIPVHLLTPSILRWIDRNGGLTAVCNADVHEFAGR